MVQVLTLAFVVVGISCALMVPIMLYAFNLRKDNFDGSPGWNWAQVWRGVGVGVGGGAGAGAFGGGGCAAFEPRSLRAFFFARARARFD